MEEGGGGIRLDKYFHISVHCTVCYDTAEGRERYCRSKYCCMILYIQFTPLYILIHRFMKLN